MTERSLPSNVDYLDMPPRAVPSERKRRKYYPANGTIYRPGQTIIIEVNDSRSLLDPANSFLEFTYQNLSARTLGLDLGGAYNFIRTLRVVQAGNEIMRCDNYNRLMNAVIVPMTNRADKVSEQSLTNFNGLQNNGDTAINNGLVNGFDMARIRLNSSGRVSATGNAQNTDRLVLSVPLVGGLFSQDKFIPLPLINEPLQIHLDLEIDGRQIGCYSGVPAEPNDALYQISNVSYTAELVEVPASVTENLRSVQRMMGGNLILPATSWEHHNATTDAAFTGETNIRIPSRKKSIKSILFCAIGTDDLGASFTDAAGNAVAGNVSRVYNLSFSANPLLKGYQMKAGSLVFPPQKILGPSGNGIGGTATAANIPDALQRRGEALQELLKAFGHTGTMIGSGMLGSISYCNNNVTINPGVGEASVSNFGADLTAATAVARRPIDLGTSAGGIAGGWKGAPFALDLEAFQKEAMMSGIDTETLALQMEMIVDVDNAAGNQASAINYDFWTWHDIVYYINENGTITYSQ